MRKKVYLDFSNPMNARVGVATVLPSSVAIAGIAIAGKMVAGRGAQPTQKDARAVNCFSHTVGNRKYLVKRSGWPALNTPQAGSLGNAILVWSGQGTGTKVITAFGNTNSSIYDGTTQLATNNADTTVITGLATSITETSVSGTATLFITSSDSTGWYYQASGTVTKIADAQFPGNASKVLAGGFAHLKGWNFVLTTGGELWSSDLNSITSWTPNNYVSADTYPDKGVAAVRWRDYIIAFGTQSMDFYKNAGNPVGSPLVHVDSPNFKIGAVSAGAIAEISDTIFFCASTPQGGLSILQFDGDLSRISTPEVDALLQLAGPASVKMTVLRDMGLSFVLVVAGGLTHVYCIENKFWFQWNGSEILWTKCAGVSVGTSQVSYAISDLSMSGKVFTIDPTTRVFQDNAAAFTALRQFATLDPGGGAFVTYEELQVKGDVATSASTLSIYRSDDDYTTWSDARTVDLSTNIPKLTREGGTKNPRAYKIEHSANLAMRLEEIRLIVEVGQ